MKTSWVISITDLEAKDKAFKHYQKSRQEVAIKAAELLAKYETIGKDRFRIAITSPHTEIDLDNRLKVSCSADKPLKEAFIELHDMNPFMYNSDESNTYFEIDQNHELPVGFSIV